MAGMWYGYKRLKYPYPSESWWVLGIHRYITLFVGRSEYTLIPILLNICECHQGPLVALVSLIIMQDICRGARALLKYYGCL